MLGRVSLQTPPGAGYEEELHCALAEGLVSRDEVESLRAEALRLQRSPLELLLERGQLSPDSLLSLRGRASPFEAPATQRPGAPPPPPSAEPAFPLPGWERYQPVRFLGQGGMGQVFLAYDPRLRRNVALKFVRDGDPQLAQRFLSEARAQARVRHERVCELYEVGEIHGRAFIAMRYVEGRHLGQLARELTLEQKLSVMRDVAEGVHAAHHAGLIHRDLKPSNILVERREDGTLKPYIMDFGLARDWHEEHTASGDVLGTPHYMAPEQARGEVGRLDRRVDVYSLGATLHHVLAGTPPFLGHNALELLTVIQTQEAPALRVSHPDIPVDVEAIVLKCLEKDRSARYDSARALGEDLERYLSGEPVRARRAGPGYRLRKRLKKHRGLVALGTTAAVGLGLALGQAALTRHQVATRERLARQFTERVERLEAQARYSALAPLHDIRPDQRALREDMRALEADIHEQGGAARAPGQYALGRALLALGDPSGALERLEAAWREGYQEPRAAHALALALGQLYQQGLPEVEWVKDPVQREARRRELERRYRDPALGYLRQSGGAGVSLSGHGAALLAFYEGDHTRALAQLDALGPVPSWLHEVPLLRGDVLQARAWTHRNAGRRAEALADLEAARAAYTAAATIGESDPAVPTALGTLELGALVLELYGPGDVRTPYTRGLEAITRALTASPEHPTARLVRARLHRRMGEALLQQGGDVLPLAQQAAVEARAVLALAPAHSLAWRELARDLRLEARYRQEHGENPAESLRAAREAFERVAPVDRDYGFHTELGHLLKISADAEEQRGGDALAARRGALDAYRAAIALDPGLVDAWLNLGTVLYQRATSPHAPDADGDLDEAERTFARARRLDPAHVVAVYYGGQVHEWRARRSLNRGGVPDAELERALALYRQGQALNGKLPQFPNTLGGALLWKAELAWEAGGEPGAALDEARACFEKARALAPQQGFADNNLGEWHAQRALLLLRRGEDPTPSARAALDAYAQALARLPKQAQLQANPAKVHHTLALWALRRGEDPSAELERATRALDAALALRPGMGYALRYQGEVESVRARWLAHGGRAQEADFERAARAFARALEADPEWPEYRLAAALHQGEWAAWRTSRGDDARPVLDEGLRQLEGALAARPTWARARAARAGLLRARAELPSTSPAEREAGRREAREALEQALAHNPHLTAEDGTRLSAR
ncbi:serine/threonine-protein kinase [Archangium primigenium]|uniref:serine/threonine-protein kinase n=1 Tax=[Archangium] primigenium TaxID=2792470 RepID=UPI00195AD995|nr:serine/threonine-protein kinase [Archangium primigenium]MBM7112426.1 protein kinase [Archangium primigenium]